MFDIPSWHTALVDNPPDRVPLLCYCEIDNSIFLGFAIHPYNKEMHIVKWYKQTGLHEWQPSEYVVTRWMKVNLDELYQDNNG